MNEQNNQARVMELIESLYTSVSEAWGVPLGNDKCIVEREVILNTLNDIKAALPVELAEAQRLVSIRDEFIGKAKREAESIRKTAEDKARAMLDEEEIYRVAKAKSAELVSNAEYKSKELRRILNEYLDERLSTAEEAVSTALSAISQTKNSFRRTTGVSASELPAAAAKENIEE